VVKVNAVNVAYTFIQVSFKHVFKNIIQLNFQCHFSISSHDKWQAMDGKYDYHEAYFQIIHAIQEPFDQMWADALLEWWNMYVLFVFMC
jgi:hypothetical protein